MKQEFHPSTHLPVYPFTQGSSLAPAEDLQGEKDIYRLRVGKYRVLFTIVGDTILIVKIGPRGDVYKEIWQHGSGSHELSATSHEP